MDREALRQRMIHRFARARREMQQLIRDAQWWNTNRPAAAPMDCEAEQVFLAAVAELPDDPSTWDARQQRQHTAAMDGYSSAIKEQPA